MANNGALPQNQIDALPLLSVAQATQASTIIRMGGSILKMFTPTDLGFNALIPTNVLATGKWACVGTNYVDLAFCSRYRATIRRVITDNSAQITTGFNCFLTMQGRAFPGDTPPASYVVAASIRDDLINIIQIGATGQLFPAIGVGETQSTMWAWGDSFNTGTIAQCTTFGGDVRFILTWATNQPTGTLAVNGFSMWLEAQT